MKKLRFADGLKPLTADMDSLHDLTETALSTLIQAITNGSTGKVLFDNIPPTGTYSAAAGTLTVTVPAQYYAVGGVVLKQAATELTVATGTTDMQVAVFLVAGREGENAVRNFLSIDPSSSQVIQQDLTHELYIYDSSRVVLSSMADLVTAIPDPTLADDDEGFIRLGTIRLTYATGAVSVVGNTTDTYTLPGGTTVPVEDHGSTHLPGGSDALPASVLSGSAAGGSTAGLLPAGGLTALLGAIQEVLPADSAGYIQVLTSGDNTTDGAAIDSRTVTLDLLLSESLTTVDTGGSTTLAVSHAPASALKGTSNRSAREDHIHPLVESGFIFQQITLAMDSGKLGTVIPYTITAAASGQPTATVAKIFSVVAMWQPPNIKAGYENRSIETGWNVVSYAGSMTTLGCRPLITGKNTFELEIGALGAAYASNAAIQAINDGDGNGSDAWTNPAYPSSGEFATSGKVFLFVLALRAGSVLLESGQ